ncbi:MAG TPA: TonB family protein [Terriglobales bacterium]|nr:TonB family protein [Terriglobales bacterium]
MAKVFPATLLALTILCSASDKSQLLALVQHAADISNLRSANTGPFRLRATVHSYGAEPANAEYSLIWVTSDQWREEISIENDHALRIGGKGTVSTKDDTEQIQAVRSQLRPLDISVLLYIKPNQSLGGVKTRNHDNVKEQCLSRTAKLSIKTELCFDAAIGVLLRVEEGDDTTEFSKYSDFKGKLFPRLVTRLNGKKPHEVIEVDELTYDSQPDPALFNIDAEYKTMAGCEHPVTPTPIELPDPVYPAELRTRDPKHVKLSATVTESGGVENIIVLRSAGPLDTYATAALEKWQFAPATCGTRAVPFQFSIEMQFKTY